MEFILSSHLTLHAFVSTSLCMEKNEFIQLRIKASDKRMVKAAAKASGLKVAQWIRQVILDAANANGKGKA
jgi:uncharacterized protein (DUF1778 family)